MPFHKTLNILYFNAFAAQSLNDVLSNFDIWMHCEEDAFSQNTQNCNILMSDKKGAAATDRSVLVVREGW